MSRQYGQVTRADWARDCLRLTRQLLREPGLELPSLRFVTRRDLAKLVLALDRAAASGGGG